MKYVIIGSGVAGITAAVNIRKLDSSGKITVLSDEQIPYYSRIRLIEYLAREVNREDIILHNHDWYEKNNIELMLDTSVSAIETGTRHIITSAGGKIEYDRLHTQQLNPAELRHCLLRHRR